MSEKKVIVDDKEMSLKDAEAILNDSSTNKPTEKEINEATKEFNKQAAAFNVKKFKIGPPKKADAIYDFLLQFLENDVYWTKNGWMGVIKMHEELSESKSKKKQKDSVVVGYQALEFLFYALSNVSGIGLKSAKAVESVSDIFIETFEYAGEQLEKARKELEDIQFLQEKVAAMQQGFYLEREDSAEEEEGFAPPSVDDLLNK